LLKILGLANPDGTPGATAPAGAPAVNPDGTAAPAAMDRTPPMLLSDPALDGGSELLGAMPSPATHPPAGDPSEEKSAAGRDERDQSVTGRRPEIPSIEARTE
jgi:hypothetical protein